MIVAVDTGGTKTLVALFGTDGTVIAEQKFATPAAIDDYIKELTQTITTLSGETPLSCISVALPGTIIDGVMVWAGNLQWKNVEVQALLGQSFDCPIIVENDANLAGLAEARSLKTIPPVCLYVTVSTGIGTGVIINGKLLPELSRTEGGRILLNRDGSYKIWEHFASGKALHERYGKLASEIEDEETWREIGENIASGMLTLLPFLRPDIVVVGGGVGTHLPKFHSILTDIFERELHDGYQPTIVQAVHPEEAVIYGCYYHALDVHLT